MPLYMDLHKGLRGVTKDESNQKHQADLNVEGKHGVHIHKFWRNEEVGTAFCLFEAQTRKHAQLCMWKPMV